MVAVITAVLAGSTAALAAILIFDHSLNSGGHLRDAGRASHDDRDGPIPGFGPGTRRRRAAQARRGLTWASDELGQPVRRIKRANRRRLRRVILATSDSVSEREVVTKFALGNRIRRRRWRRGAADDAASAPRVPGPGRDHPLPVEGARRRGVSRCSRLVPTRANGQPAFGCYLATPKRRSRTIRAPTTSAASPLLRTAGVRRSYIGTAASVGRSGRRHTLPPTLPRRPEVVRSSRLVRLDGDARIQAKAEVGLVARPTPLCMAGETRHPAAGRRSRATGPPAGRAHTAPEWHRHDPWPNWNSPPSGRPAPGRPPAGR